MEQLQRREATGFVTPLRFPGGKRKLFPFFRDLILHNNLVGAHYVEPFAGGAGLALSLMVSGYIGIVHLNDLDTAIFAFWKTVLDAPEELCGRIESTPVDLTVWRQQRRVIEHPEDYSEVDVAFAVLFLNRTNRSGILRGGVIGGWEQAGPWRMDARFNRHEIISRVRLIAAHRERIRVYHQDAVEFLSALRRWIPVTESCLVYADPPYYARGCGLYYHTYGPHDHRRLAQTMKALSVPWVVSYDHVEDIYALYPDAPYLRYQLSYTAQARQHGEEIMFFHNLEIPRFEKGGYRWRPMRVA